MAQYYANFSTDTTGAPPAGFTYRWETGGTFAWNVVAYPGAVGGQLVTYTAGNTANRLLVFDAVDADPDRANVEVLTRFDPPNTSGFAGIAALRASGTGSNSVTGYCLSLYGNQLVLQRYIYDGEFGGAIAYGACPTVRNGQLAFVRFRINGSSIRAKLWISGDPEPIGWNLVHTDTGITAAGWVGLYARDRGDRADYDFISVATNGDTAAFTDTVPVTVHVEDTQLRVLTATEIATNIQASQIYSMAAGIYPTEFIETSELVSLAAVDWWKTIEVPQVAIMVAARGRIDNPKLKAWTYTLDGHSFYVLRLGNGKSLVYDLSTEQWSWFHTGVSDYWEVQSGFNWKSAGKNSFEKGSNVLVGHDTVGYLYFLDPMKPNDDRGSSKVASQKAFLREATAQAISRQRKTIPCYEVYLTGSSGNPSEVGATGVELLYSDDVGHNYVSAGVKEVPLGDWVPEFSWRSLGLISQPGRLFKIKDYGALARVDGLDMSLGGVS